MFEIKCGTEGLFVTVCSGVFDFWAGLVRNVNAARRPDRASGAAWWVSVVLDFGVADGNLTQGGVDVIGFDVGCSGTS